LRRFWIFRSVAFRNHWREPSGASAMQIRGDHHATT
jgi:hypothetical protein